MFYILTSLISASMMGAGDFFGGVASKSSPVAIVGLIGQAIGLVTVIIICLVGGHAFAQTPFCFGLAAGVCGSVALLSLYRGLAVGKVAIVAPLSAVLGALIPVVVHIFTGHHFGPPKWIGIVVGLIAVYFLSLRSEEEGTEAKETGLVHAIIAGFSLAAFYMLLGNEENHGSIWTLLGERCTVVSIMWLSMICRKLSLSREIPGLKYIIIAGVCDIFGNLAFLYSTTAGPLPMVALITSLYPASTLLLGWILLKEPLNRRLFIGIICAFICIILFSIHEV